MEVYIRPLIESDALISYKWRNDPEVWKYTGNRPDILVTKEVEIKWLKNALQSIDSKRFAICLKNFDLYVGNIQLTHISDSSARFHIFIGEKKYWGKGIAQKSTKLILLFAKNNLKLKNVYLYVNLHNIAAIAAYKKTGFKFAEFEKERMTIQLKNFDGEDL